ncbi:MAG: hypothetical protein HFI31_11010 [Lachnospiraceae bacterium]|jgi:hypothetical protein|nr:hypothetical protein [Lachnospiraceae bacterium]
MKNEYTNKTLCIALKTAWQEVLYIIPFPLKSIFNDREGSSDEDKGI